LKIAASRSVDKAKKQPHAKVIVKHFDPKKQTHRQRSAKRVRFNHLLQQRISQENALLKSFRQYIPGRESDRNR